MAYIPIIRTARLDNDAVNSAKILDNAIVAADINASLKPSGTAAAGDEALRALGYTTGTALAGTNSLAQIAANNASAGDITASNQKITNLGTPVSATDAATKGYVDGVATGLDVKASVRVATTGNITLSGTQTIDGVAVIAGNRVLVKDQTDPVENGLYAVAAGAWSRASDADTDMEVTAGLFTFATEGTVNGDTGWVLVTDDPIVVDTDPLSFTQFSSAISVSTLNSLTDVDTTGVVDGSLLRYESSGSVWNDTAALLFSDAGQLQVTTTGSSAGVLIGGDTQLYRSAADVLRTPDALTVDGLATLSGGATVAGRLTNTAGVRRNVSSTKTGAYTVVLATDDVIRVDSTSAAFAVDLPASHSAGDQVEVKDVGGACYANNVTVTTADSDTIDGQATFVLDTNYQKNVFTSDGTNWMVG